MMKYLRKTIALLISIAVLANLCVFVSATDEPSFAKHYKTQSYVAIKGNAGAENEGYDASLMLYKTNAAPDENSIGYIGQTTIDSNGDYKFEFTFSDFEYDESNTVSNYVAVLNVNGEKMHPTVTSASVISELVTFELDFSNFGKAIAEITNTYGLENLRYKLIVGFYNESGALLGAKFAQKYIGDEAVLNYTYEDIPEDTYSAKGFLWEDTERIIPLADTQEFAVKDYTINGEAMCLAIAPGSTELDRNFAWYELPDIEGVKLQYAVKTSESDLSEFPEADAVTVDAAYGSTDVSKHNGVQVINRVFKYDYDYSWAKASITNLEPNTEYVYRVGNKLGWRPGIYSFKTEDPAEVKKGFSFLLYTDEHATLAGTVAKDSLNNTREQALKTYEETIGEGEEPSLIYSLGDVVNWAYEEEAYAHYFDWDKATRIPLAGAVGNHDYVSGVPGASVYDFHFNMPNQSKDNPAANYSENMGSNYWFTYGDVLFISLTSNLPSSLEKNKEFIKQVTEANPDPKWRIVCSHYPFINGSDSTVKDGVSVNSEKGTASKLFADGDFLDEYDIDMTFTGHEHEYYRSWQMKGTELAATQATEAADGSREVTDPDGVVHFSLNTGSWQSSTYASQRWFEAYGDDLAIQYYSKDKEGNNYTYYNSYFTIVSTETTDNETVLTVKTYKNTASRNTHEITDTELIDSYKITKTKDR